MKTNATFLAATAALHVLSAGFPVLAAPTTPSRVSTSQLGQFPYRTSGAIWNDSFRGSGTVARDPYIAVSCAHVVFDSGTWLRGNHWSAAYHSASYPGNSASAKPLRGYWYWTSYTGGTSTQAFSQDYVVHYATSQLAGGAAAGWSWHDSATAHPLAGGTSKLIVGYPGDDGFFQNSVGSFTSRYTSQDGHFLWNSSVKGAGGMSGGGVFVGNGVDWYLAGVHVAGRLDGGLGAGVRALDQRAFDLMTNAIESSRPSAPVPVVNKAFSSTKLLKIRDNSSTWTVSSLPVSGMPASLTAARVSVSIKHGNRGDLQVTLAAPNGRIVTLHDRAGAGAKHLVISNRDLSGSFAGSNPNGTWRLSVRDLSRRKAGRLNSVTLDLSSR